jgi:hypothetical protein
VFGGQLAAALGQAFVLDSLADEILKDAVLGPNILKRAERNVGEVIARLLK